MELGPGMDSVPGASEEAARHNCGSIADSHNPVIVDLQKS
jgi:hypothetical protein